MQYQQERRCLILFFIGIFGTDAKVAPVGEIQGVSCPVCASSCNLAVVKRFHYFHAFFIPVFRWGKGYLATCGCCASVLELSPQQGKELEHTGSCRPSPQDFHHIKDNNRGRCPHCKAFNPPGSRFCNHCGAGL